MLFQPHPDADLLALEQADEIIQHVADVQQLQALALTCQSMDPVDRSLWGKAYFTARWQLLEKEQEIARTLMHFPWTIHAAGAPGEDKEHDCGDPECENPWCGRVQKCSRCQEILSFGFSATGSLVEHMTAMMGRSWQDYMEDIFGTNAEDEDGPTWFPLGTRVAQRVPVGAPGVLTWLPDHEERALGPNEPLMDCEPVQLPLAVLDELPPLSPS